MTAQPQIKTHLTEGAYLPQTDSLLLRLAWWITQIGSPPVLGLAGILLVGAALGFGQHWPLLLMYASLALLLPFGFVLWLLRQGKVSDYNLTKREERFWPMVVSMASALVGWVLLSQLQAPALLLALAATNLAQSVVYFFITLRWKVSIHSAVAAGLAVLGSAVAGGTVWLLVLAVPLIAWSRVVLRRHTLAQTVVGAAIGSLFFAFALLFYGV
jgi:membrane-associated phospholipid phosphatase